MKYQTQKSLFWMAVIALGAIFAITPQTRAQISTGAPFTTFSIGTLSTQNGLLVTSTNVASQTTFLTAGEINIGGSNTAANTAQGGSLNVVIISNALFKTDGSKNSIGISATNNTFTLLNSTWDLGSSTGGGTNKLVIGATLGGSGVVIASNNIVNILDNSIFSNGWVFVGLTNGSGPVKFSAWNGFIVSNGSYAQMDGLIVGSVQANAGFMGYSNNFAYVSNVVNTAGANGISTGPISIGDAGGVSNRVTLADVVWAAPSEYAGAPTTVTNNGTLEVGGGRSTVASTIGNSLTIQNGSIVTNFNSITVGYNIYAAYSGTHTNYSNSIVVTDPHTVLSEYGTLVVGGATGGNGAGNGGASNNTLQVLAGATLLTTNMYQGYANSPGSGAFKTLADANSIVVDNATWTNNGDAFVGYAYNNNATTVEANHNSLLVADGATFWTTNLTEGVAANVGGAGIVSAVNNSILVSNGATVVTKELNIGYSVNFGSGASSTGNSLMLTNNSVLEVGTSMTIGGNGGNTISNYGSTYQFTSANPTIVNDGYGNIAINNGTISYRAIVNADVTLSTNQSSSLAGIQFNGSNGFQLNNAANTGAAASQDYVFQSSSSPSNYASLSMINGTTAYGGNIGIGSGGSMLVSNTTATLDGSLINEADGILNSIGSKLFVTSFFTNNGTLKIVNSVGTFNSAVVNNGTWVSDPSTLVFSSTFSNGPAGVIISTNDTYVFKSNFLNQATSAVKGTYNTVNGNFVFSGDGSTQIMQVAGLSLGGYGSSFTNWATNSVFFTANSVNVSTNAFHFNPGPPQDSIAGFSNNFAVGNLTINNTTLELGQQTADTSISNGLYLGQLTLGTGGDLIVSNNVQVYFKGTNGVTGLAFGDWAENPGADVLLLDGAGFHELIVTPEPSILLLWVLGFASVYYVRRRKKTAPSPR